LMLTAVFSCDIRSQPEFDRLLCGGRDMLVQRFMPNIATEGELSFIFIEGTWLQA
jgi:hypothetical protein